MSDSPEQPDDELRFPKIDPEWIKPDEEGIAKRNAQLEELRAERAALQAEREAVKAEVDRLQALSNAQFNGVTQELSSWFWAVVITIFVGIPFSWLIAKMVIRWTR